MENFTGQSTPTCCDQGLKENNGGGEGNQPQYLISLLYNWNKVQKPAALAANRAAVEGNKPWASLLFDKILIY